MAESLEPSLTAEFDQWKAELAALADVIGSFYDKLIHSTQDRELARDLAITFGENWLAGMSSPPEIPLVDTETD